MEGSWLIKVASIPSSPNIPGGCRGCGDWKGVFEFPVLSVPRRARVGRGGCHEHLKRFMVRGDSHFQHSDSHIGVQRRVTGSHFLSWKLSSGAPPPRGPACQLPGRMGGHGYSRLHLQGEGTGCLWEGRVGPCSLSRRSLLQARAGQHRPKG